MKIGPYCGYYGRAAWNDATQRFEGHIICPKRVRFHSVKEKNIVLNFQKCVTKYVKVRGFLRRNQNNEGGII